MALYDLILFDLDGTLADTSDDIADALEHALERQRRPAVPRDRIVAAIGGGVRKLIERCVERDPEPVLEAFLARYSGHLLDRTRLYPEVAATLRKIKVDKVILSNKPTAFCSKIVEGLGIAGEFAGVFGGDAFPEKKPDPAVVRRVTDRFPGRALFVGDSGTDIETARAAGIPVGAVTYGYHRPGELEAADWRVDAFPGILDHL